MGSGSGISCNLRLNTVLTPVQRDIYQNTNIINTLLQESKTVAIIGLSTESQKASNMVASYLQDEGYRIVPVNPRADMILGEKSYPDLKSIPFKVDIVDIFRPASEVMSIVEHACAINAGGIWMQLRIVDLNAAEIALQSGLKVVVDKCIKMEHGRFNGGLHMAGMNTEIISARKSRWK